MPQQLKARAALPEDPSLVPCTQVGQLPNAATPAPGYPRASILYRYLHTCVYTLNNKKIF